MGLTQALSTAVSGLNAAQRALSIVSSDVANAQTPGYVAKTTVQTAIAGQVEGSSVLVSGVQREIDTFVQTQLRQESSGGAFADRRAELYKQLNQLYGQPGSNTNLDALYNAFTTAAQSVATTPQSSAAQSGLLSAAQALAGQLNSMSTQIQSLRTLADQGIGADVDQINTALQTIARTNTQLAGASHDATAAALEDQRDLAIDQLAKMMDIRVSVGDHNQVTIFSGSGIQLVAGQAVQLSFTTQGTITPNQLFDPDPTKSSLSSIDLIGLDGSISDFLQTGGFRSGEIAANLDMRDNVLVQAQNQLDELASQISKALSDLTVPGAVAAAPAPPAGQAGFDLDISSVLPGNSIQLAYTDASGTLHNVTVVRVDDPTALPLPNSTTPDPNDRVVGVNFGSPPSLASIALQLNTALTASGLQFSNPAGTTLRVLNAPGPVVVQSASTTVTTTSLTAGVPQVSLFDDGGSPYTGAITAINPQKQGFAARISINKALLEDPSKVVVFNLSPPTPAGDATRPNFILNQLNNPLITFSSSTGIGGATLPFQGSISSFMGQVISQQSQAANAAASVKQGQDIVVGSLQQRFNDSSAVNVDTEMSRLLTLQSSYGANARVLTTVKQMLEQLLQIGG